MRKVSAKILWAIYMLTIPFLRILNLPVVGQKLQLPEIAFLPILAKSAAHMDLNVVRRRSWYRFLDVTVIIWPFLQLFSCLLSGFTRASVVEVLGAGYLVGLYFCMRLLADRDLLKAVPRTLVVAAMISAVLGLVGWGLSMFFSVHTRLAWPSTVPLPYFGYVARAQGFMTSPNMLASLLMVGIIFQLGRIIRDRKLCWKLIGVLGVLLLCFALTFSKTVICLAAGCAVTAYLAWQPGKARVSIRLLVFSFVAVCALVYTVVCHVVVTPVGAEDLPLLIKEGYISDHPLVTFPLRGKNYGVYPTNYAHNKNASVEALKSSKGLGVGGGNYNAFIQKLQSQGKHPHWFPPWDPHSTYFGALAELGVLGLIGVLLIGIALGRLIFYDLLKRNGPPNVLLCGLAGIFVAVLLEAICTDVMNFRQYWLLIAAARVSADLPREGPEHTAEGPAIEGRASESSAQ